MKKLIGLAIFAVILFLMFVANPGKDSHVEALAEDVTEITMQEFSKYCTDPEAITPEVENFLKMIAQNSIEVDNYGIFSLGNLDILGNSQVVSLGICGRVFTFNDKIVKAGIEFAQKAQSKATVFIESAKKARQW